MRFKRKIISLLPWLLLSACAHQGGVQPVEPDPQAQTSASSQARFPVQRIGPPGSADLDSPVADVMYHIMVAEAAAARGHLAVAVDYYLYAARRSRDPRVAERAAKVANFARRYEEALEAVSIWREGEPDSVTARQMATVLYLRTGKYDLARNELELILAEGNESALGRAFVRIGALFQREAPVEESFEMAEYLAGLYPDVPEAAFVAASAALAAEHGDKALEWVEKALSTKPDWQDAVLLRTRVLILQKRRTEALEYLQSYLEKHPKQDKARMAYARALIDARKLEEARQQFELLAVKMPENEEVLFALAMLSVQFKEMEEAKGYLQQLIKQGKRTPQIIYYMGQIAEQRENYDKAMQWYGDVPKSDYWLDAQLRMAVVLSNTRDLSAARAFLQSIPTENADNRREILLFEGTLLKDNKAYGEAYELYSDALEDYPRDIDILYARALVAERIDKVDEAVSDLRYIVKRQPDNAAALNALGYTLADRTDRYVEALELIEQALAIEPDDPAIMDSMGWALFRLGKYEEALEYLEQAMEQVEDGEVAAHYGEVLWAAKRYQEARDVWNKALEKFGDNEILQRTIQRFSEQ